VSAARERILLFGLERGLAANGLYAEIDRIELFEPCGRRQTAVILAKPIVATDGANEQR
jgi:hypothetical protein